MYIKDNINLSEQSPIKLFKIEPKQKVLHSHSCLEIDLILKGDGTYIVGNNYYDIQNEQIYLINSNEKHVAIHTGTLEIIVLIFRPDLFSSTKYFKEYMTSFLNSNFGNRICNDSEKTNEIVNLVHKMYQEYNNKDIGYMMLLESLLFQLMTLFYRYYQSNVKHCDMQNKKEDEKYHKVIDILEFIHFNYANELTLDMLARKVNLSKNYICNFFKSNMNLTVFEYIHKVRLEVSVHLLLSSDLSITEVATNSGFSDITYYNKVFKKHYKMSPSKFRKANKKL